MTFNCTWKHFALCKRITKRMENPGGHNNVRQNQASIITSHQDLFSQEQTYIVAPGENRAPLCGYTGACATVDTWPGLVGVYWDDGGTVRVAWGSGRLWATRTEWESCEVHVQFEKLQFNKVFGCSFQHSLLLHTCSYTVNSTNIFTHLNSLQYEPGCWPKHGQRIRVESKGAIVNQLNILTSELIIYSFNCTSEECNVISINLLLLSVLFHTVRTLKISCPLRTV